jgi:hypothetical protein
VVGAQHQLVQPLALAAELVDRARHRASSGAVVVVR